jgi:hypothetical protein
MARCGALALKSSQDVKEELQVMRSSKGFNALALVGACAVVTAAAAAFGQQIFKYSQTEPTTARYDAQRTGWIPVDRFIAPDKMSGFALQWKTKVDNRAVNGAALGGGVVNPNAGLGISVAYVGASDNRTIGIDMDTGHVFFDRSYGAAPPPTGNCLDASLATPARNTPLTQPIPGPMQPAGQAAMGPNTQLPFGSVLGEPGEGIPPVKPGAYFATPGSFFGVPNSGPFTGTPESASTFTSVAKAAPPAPRGGGFQGPPAPPGAPAPAVLGPVNADGGGPIGAPPVQAASAAAAGPLGAPPAAAGAAGAAARPAQPRLQFVGPATYNYAISSDGTLHALSNNDGLDVLQPMPFLPKGAQANDVTLIAGTIYASTSNSCGGAPNGIWAIKPAATPAGGSFPKPTSWTTGGTASPSMPSFNADGTIYVAVSSGTGNVSDAIVSLDPATLEVKNMFKLPGANFSNAPVIFRIDKRDILAAQAADGRIILLDGSLAKPLFVSQPEVNLGEYKPAAMAAWQDSAGQRWLLAATAKSAVAYKVSLSDSSASLSEGWTLSGLKSPLAPLVINGVAFVLSSGDSASGPKGTAELFAMDAATGKTLWSSGKTIAGYVPRSSSLWSSMGQVLLATADSTIYAFGMNMERHL